MQINQGKILVSAMARLIKTHAIQGQGSRFCAKPFCRLDQILFSNAAEFGSNARCVFTYQIFDLSKAVGMALNVACINLVVPD